LFICTPPLLPPLLLPPPLLLLWLSVLLKVR
jgi:hypothetical protein